MKYGWIKRYISELLLYSSAGVYEQDRNYLQYAGTYTFVSKKNMHSSFLKFGDTAAARDISQKLGLTSLSNSSGNKPQGPCYLHDLMVNPTPYKHLSETDEHPLELNHKTSFYLCRRYNPALEFEHTPRYVMKRMAYRKKNKVDRFGASLFNDPDSKNYDQIQTQFSCYSLLKDSYRCIQLIELLHENFSSKEDKKFFYRGLKLPDKRSKDIRNICFILEEMNEGSLQDQIALVKSTKQPFSQEKIIEYACQFAEGLLELKAKGIVHRDLRPENVLIHDGQLKFSDFDSAFIKGYSDYRNIKNGVYMKDTMPHQIMLLIAESQEKLKTYSSEELYKLQEKADIYFLGVTIYSMVFSQPYESFNGGTVLNNLIGIKKRQGFNHKLLDLMSNCLQKDPHVRISLQETVSILAQIEQKQYIASSSYRRVYLSTEPLNLHSFSCHHPKQNSISQPVERETINREELETNMKNQLKKATLERNTAYYEALFRQKCEDIDLNKLWNSEQYKIFAMNQNNLTQRVENFLERLQIKAYYYELVYRIFCEVNLASIPSHHHFQHIKAHSQNFHNQLVLLLTFLYRTIMKCSFTDDPHYDTSKMSYEVRRVAQTIKDLHSRWQFFSGRLKLHNQNINFNKKIQEKLVEKKQNTTEQSQLRQIEYLEQAFKVTFDGIKRIEQLENILNSLKQTDYEDQQQRMSFPQQERYIMRCLDKVESLIKQQMVKTIVGLILAYQEIKKEQWGHKTNLKNAIFMIMILQAQNTKKMHKNDIVIIRNQLTNFIKLRLGWRSQQLEAFFNNYVKTHPQEVIQGLCHLESQAAIPRGQEEDICIQINGKDSGVFDSSIKSEQGGKGKTEEDEVIERGEQNSYKFITVEEYCPKNKNQEQEQEQKQKKLKQQTPEQGPKDVEAMRQTFDFKLFQSQLGKNKISSIEEVPQLRPNMSIQIDRLDE